jgi:hypothetical protein
VENELISPREDGGSGACEVIETERLGWLLRSYQSRSASR